MDIVVEHDADRPAGQDGRLLKDDAVLPRCDYGADDAIVLPASGTRNSGAPDTAETMRRSGNDDAVVWTDGRRGTGAEDLKSGERRTGLQGKELRWSPRTEQKRGRNKMEILKIGNLKKNLRSPGSTIMLYLSDYFEDSR